MAILKALGATARGITRVVKALLAAAITIGVLAGIPWGLLHYAGDPLPHSVPTLDAIKHTLTNPMTPQMLLKALSVVGWYLWLILAVSFAVELVAAARRVNAPHVPTLGPTQALAAALITAIGLTALLRAAPAHAAETSSASVPTGGRVAATAPALAGTGGLTTAHLTVGSATSTAPRESVHTVRPGESLYSIAAEDLGNGDDWPQLYKLNAGVAQADGDKLTNPDLIRPDWKIRITATAADPATSIAGAKAVPAPTAQPPVPPTPATSAPALSAPTAPPSATGPATPSAPPTAMRNPSHPAVADDSSQQHAVRRHGGAAVGLPDGGAIGITLAVALGSALVLARRWRTRLSDPRFPTPEPPLPGARQAARRAHLALTAPTPLPTPQPDEPALVDEDLYDVPGADEDHEFLDVTRTAAADTDSVREREVANSQDPIDGYFDDDPDWLGEASDEVDDGEEPDYGLGIRYGVPLAPGSISAAERDGAEIPLPPTGPGLGLVGPGAAGAARAIAASVLSAGAPDRTADLARLIIPAADLAMLLGVEAAALSELTRGVPELTATADLATAIGEAEVHALWRTSLLEEYEVPDLDALAEQHPEEVDCPPLVLMASPARADALRIAALIEGAAHLRITAVMLGAHPTGVTAFVEADGRVSGPGLADWAGTRLFDLSADSLTAVLRLLAAASGNQSPAQEPAPPVPRAELTVVANQGASDQVPTALGDDALPTLQQNVAADMPSPSHSDDGAEDGLAVPRLVLVADPAEQIAADMLQAWSQRSVRISVLGPLRIEANGAPVTKMRSQARTLAALLAWKGAVGISDAGIDAACMPDEDDLERVARWRQDGLKSLRARLRESTGHKTGRFVELRDRREYRLDPEQVAVDLWLFRALHAAAGAAREEPDQLRWLRHAVEVCGGELLADQTSPDFAWADSPRVTVRSEQVEVLTRYAELAARAGEQERALAALRRAASIADDNEYIYLRMFDLLAELGRHAEIAAQMHVLDAAADAVGATVSTATRQHAASLLRPGAAASTSPGGSGRSDR